MSNTGFVPQTNGSNPILVVEDNESIRQLIEIVLKSAGHEVHGVGDGESALVAAQSIHPRLILMDVQLPGMDGLELARRLKTDAGTADITIVAVTAFAMESDREKAREAGCDGYISKPLDVNALTAAVSGYIGPKSADFAPIPQ
jgi:CheY-like chemotaxis protein